MNHEIFKIESSINYSFIDKELIQEALTHSSYSNENGQDIFNNERLEFLGDAVLEILISDYLFARYKSLSEGKLTRIRSMVVCEEVLYELSAKLDLGECLRLGKGEELTGGRTKKSILADGFEALIAAIYIDAGIEKVRKLILPKFISYIERAFDGSNNLDYKTRIQEIIQKDIPGKKLKYLVYNEDGPDHDKIFYINLYLDHQLIGRGEGKSKKAAEQEAARNALTSKGWLND
jgi:ribonuclease III